MIGSSGLSPIWDIRSLIRRSATSCAVGVYRRRRSANAGPRIRDPAPGSAAMLYMIVTRYASLPSKRAPPVRSLSLGAESSMVAPKNECLSKVIFFGDRSSHRMTKSHTERNHQRKSTILLLQQIAEMRAVKKRLDAASDGVNPCVITNKTRRE